jgi:hypothetical protein
VGKKAFSQSKQPERLAKQPKPKTLHNAKARPQPEKVPPLPEIKPVWDAETRILSWNGIVVKEFRQWAENQEKALNALQASGWRPRIDNPFTGEFGQDPHDVLHDTINALNDYQRCELLHFRGDGKGGLCWNLTKKALAMLCRKKPTGSGGNRPEDSLPPR